MITTITLGKILVKLEKYKVDSAASRYVPHYAAGALSFCNKLIKQQQLEYSECCDFLRMVYHEHDTLEFMDAQDWLKDVFDIIVPTGDL
ncbi:hypothetical protein VPKG_00043 [Vibrio phage pYD21-A]|uniref:hypothetical protein n=1 Tax=Vibrio phage pYD21-A TaxID=754049 RepID=UPI0002C0E144|nr:hypothetical protein VPKG_00043 [Vibrio phage pYD21-A]AGH16080.1 hypothetical protein VPKG_00043 [Vibrio phage pYD21-A]